MLLLAPAMLDIPPSSPAPVAPRIWVKPKPTPGRHVPLSVGTLYIPANLDRSSPVPVVIHFHGNSWLPEQAEAESGHPFAVISVDLGVGSDIYTARFANPGSFRHLLEDASKRIGAPIGPVTLSGFSAGYGAVREILKYKSNWDAIDTVVLVDGMHTAYRTIGRSSHGIVPEEIEPFVAFAREAVAGRKRMLVTHTEVSPGAYASTTETADYLLSNLSLTRKVNRQPGPFRSMHQLSDVQQGQFHLLGFAGTEGTDHFDQFQALATWWKLAEVWEPQRAPAAAGDTAPTVLISLTNR